MEVLVAEVGAELDLAAAVLAHLATGGVVGVVHGLVLDALLGAHVPPCGALRAHGPRVVERERDGLGHETSYGIRVAVAMSSSVTTSTRDGTRSTMSPTWLMTP